MDQGQRTPVLFRPQQPQGWGRLQVAGAHGRPTDMSRAQGQGSGGSSPPSMTSPHLFSMGGTGDPVQSTGPQALAPASARKGF